MADRPAPTAGGVLTPSTPSKEPGFWKLFFSGFGFEHFGDQDPVRKERGDREWLKYVTGL